jgi:hypothetical protein
MKARLFVTLLLAAILSACGGSSSTTSPTTPTPTPVTTTLQGTVAGNDGLQSGSLTVVVQAAVSASALRKDVHALSTATASGTLTLAKGGGVFTLTGTFDTSAGTLNLSGGGFVLTGTISQGAMSGTYTGPEGTSGGFAGLDATHGGVTNYCGTWSGGGQAGVFNLAVSASGAVSMVASSTSDPCTVFLSGVLNGTALTTISSVSCGQPGGKATGTVQGGMVNGTWISKNGKTGAFSGSTSACK